MKARMSCDVVGDIALVLVGNVLKVNTVVNRRLSTTSVISSPVQLTPLKVS